MLAAIVAVLVSVYDLDLKDTASMTPTGLLIQELLKAYQIWDKTKR